MARPFWSGQLRISLVSFGINLIPAIEAKSEIRFHQIDRQTGERVRHQKVSSADDEPVETSNIVKGYEYSKGEYLQLEQEEVENLRIASRHTIDLEQFVSTDAIPLAFYEKPYFVTPENSGQAEAFAVVREALEETKRVGIGKVAMGGRERLIAITAASDAKLNGLMAYTLRFAAEVRRANEYFSGVEEHKVDREQLALAKELIQKKSSAFKPEQFTDNYEAALRELIDAKLKHAALPKEKAAAPRGAVVNLMDALRQSLKGKGSAKRAPAARRAAHRPVKNKKAHRSAARARKAG